MTDINRLLASLKRRSAHAKEFGDSITFVKLKDIDALVEALEKAQQRNGELETYSKTALEFREAARDENRHLKLELEIAEKRIAGLEESHAQVIKSRDHYKRMLEEGLEQLAESRTVTIEPFRSFVTGADLAALHRFAECCDDPESGGHDLDKEQVRRLESIGALQRSGRISYITGFGDFLISITAGIKWEAE
ncbi:hypothetical protein [Klebsiella aerogenes]|uniref:hypothetical protein n=1 Tax=Klebsiella aerogenes TaxID=548 RepID=UPI00044BD3BB|nr:hypothetical protein [Klebsiella aerogenes]EKV7529774.1 hypothetical protein [Klebsiella aerogenes]ELA2524401.1 hypothetical protein [Klebsiella aerogenes]EUL55892.1 hypothetical protein P848_02553 [Klebsiella aerogenes UCI 45]EUL75722.1 hypothetical protein P831_04298 [Klebsiella aerogenes UCI 28]EUL83258.1 hypothetical protein P830_02273 [Klebsiella aerogenes UCI 27]